MHFLRSILMPAMLLLTIALAWVLPPKLYPILQTVPPPRLLRVGALLGLSLALLGSLVLCLLVLLTSS